MDSTERIVDELSIDIVRNIVRSHTDDPTAAVLHFETTPLAHDGLGGSTVQRMLVAWREHGSEVSANWIVKGWEPGGMSELLFGLKRPLEMLAWEQGLLKPAALPDGVCVPIIWAGRSPDEQHAWVVMEDVGADLAVYSRSAPVATAHAYARTKAILARLARFHVAWERPEQRTRLRGCHWLLPLETYVWCGAANYAAVLAGNGDDWADIEAFLGQIPARSRRLWRDMLIDRTRLVVALTALPQTLLHHDLDDRNIGLRWRVAGDDNPILVLIDWEWLGRGPAALDVARVVMEAIVARGPQSPIPEAYWSDELPDYYFACYQEAGGVALDYALWQHAYGLARIQQSMWTLPWILGRSIRVLEGSAEPFPLPQFPVEDWHRWPSALVELSDHILERVSGAVERLSR